MRIEIKINAFDKYVRMKPH